MRGLWLTSHVLGDAEGAAAARAAAALGDDVHARLLEAGDRLAAISPLLAQRYYVRAAAAHHAFGPAGFERWLALGEDLASREPVSRDAALAYFAAAPAEFGAGGVGTAAAWARLARRVAAVSRRAAGAFLERSRPLLAGADAEARLDAWVTAGLGLGEGPRGATLVQAWFEASPELVQLLPPRHHMLLADVVRALGPVVGERALLAEPPPGLARCTPAERETLLRATRTLGAGAASAALAVWRALPEALARLAPEVRAAMVRVVAHLGPRAAAPLAETAPVVGALLAAVPAAERVPVLRLVEEVAVRSPEATVAALRVLPRLFETARPDVVRAWFATGLRFAEERPDAASAYFGLESRTSVRALEASTAAATLEDARGVWTKLVQMVSGTPATARPFEGLTLRPPLEEEPARDEVALPLRVDVFPTYEENSRLYRLLAAQVAGRRAFGTYADPGLVARLRDPERPALLEPFFLLAEAVRVQHRLDAIYPGFAADARVIGARLLESFVREPSGTQSQLIDALLAHVFAGASRATAAPRWLAPGAAAAVVWLVRPLALPTATAEDSFRVAEALVGAALTEGAVVDAEAGASGALLPELAGEFLLEGEEGDFGGEATAPAGPAADGPLPGEDDSVRIELAPPGEEGTGGQALSLEEMLRLLRAGARVEQGTGEMTGPGLSAADLLGKLPPAEREALRETLAALEAGEDARAAASGSRERHGACFWYDEWDHRLGDYRSRWCRLFEVDLGGDDGQFFSRVLADYGDLVPQVRREFQRIRPEMYRPLRGLEDGEDFDLNAVVEARVELRARRAPSQRLYSARVREARDVATLFLVDMSASTDEPAEAPRDDRPPRRIIDVTRAALVVMAEALEELGDAYAVYGFSGQGRNAVEVYPVKSFAEPLGDAVKARIGGMAPRRSTRMGAALRHVVGYMGRVGARSKHLILLSDGFPQDLDYGDDRRSHVYGLRDTAAALREAIAAHVSPLCITVDRAGHDYLREMCDASRYVVIEDIALLPRELPKIYRRVVRP